MLSRTNWLWTSTALCVLMVNEVSAQEPPGLPQLRKRPPHPVAMLVDVQGTMNVVTGHASVPGRRMLMLRPEDRLERSGDARVKLIFLADLHYEVLRGTSAVVGQQQCEPADAVERIEAPELQHKPALAKLRELAPDASGAAGVLGRARNAIKAPSPGSRPLITPSNDTAVVTDRPAFSWPAQGADAEYHFTLVDVDSGGTTLDQTTRLSRLALAADRPALTRGHFYQWQVATQTVDQKPLKINGEFWVLDADEAKHLEQLASLADSSKSEEVLLAAITYRAYECADDALKMFERLLRLVPDDPFVRSACEQAYRQVGRFEDAERLRREGMNAGSTQPSDRKQQPVK